MLQEFRHTNYACPDLELIEQIYKVLYQQKVAGVEHHRFLRRHEVKSVQARGDAIELRLHDVNADRETTAHYDAVVLATGYGREQHKSLLAPLASYLPGFQTDRHYRVHSVPQFRPAVFLQGASESSHGLSDTLLSVTAIRAGEILEALEAASMDIAAADADARHALQA